MPKTQIFQLHPVGWEQDPEDEYIEPCPLDYCVAQSYNNWGLFFKLPDAVDRKDIVETLFRGLEITLSQCRHLCGHISERPGGGGALCFHKKRESTVEFHVQQLDQPEDKDKYPSFADLEKQHFTSRSLGDLDVWCVSPMSFGEKPEAQLSSNSSANPLKVAAFKASFIRGGGLVFMMHNHHFANDLSGWVGSFYQLAENCAAVWGNSAAYPPWDSACLDLSFATKPSPEAEALVDVLPPPARHPDHRPAQWLLFHLPRSKAAELKRLASPKDGSSFWISTFDAYMAYTWRMLTKHRARLLGPSYLEKSSILWGLAVNMRPRTNNPPVPARLQCNFMYVPMSTACDIPQLTPKEVISDAPLSKLAWYNRELGKSATQSNLDAVLTHIAAVRDKTRLHWRIDGFPPLSNITTDWRGANPYDADFGFGRPCAFRHPFGNPAANGCIVVYPPRKQGAMAGEDEGVEILIACERDIAGDLIEDPEWNKYFEFRGVDG